MNLVLGPAVVDWVAKRTNEFGRFGSETAIGWHNQRLVAGVVYAQWNGPNVVCHIAAEGKRWATRQYLWTIFDYPFNQLKCRRITVEVGEGNEASRKFVEHLGFKLEAILAGAHPTGDLRIYRMFAGECRYLKAPYAPQPRTNLLRAAA